jgi:hypothetical protein
MYVLGGIDLKEDTLSDVWVLDIIDFEELMDSKQTEHKMTTWKKVDTAGKGPGKFSHHTSVLFKNHIIVYCGLTNCVNDPSALFSLDLRSFKWTKINAKV